MKNIIAVSSCKGGVGKSTVASNLAFALHRFANKKVGIFDADIYGPSLPTLLNKTKEQLRADANDPNTIIPVDYEGIKAMSFGFVSPNKRAVIRGPMISSIVSTLFYNTMWGDLDYLIVDMPPGTGDIQITLGQEVAQMLHSCRHSCTATSLLQASNICQSGATVTDRTADGSSGLTFIRSRVCADVSADAGNIEDALRVVATAP